MISLIQGWISGNGEVQRMEYDAFKDGISKAVQRMEYDAFKDGISEKRFRGWNMMHSRMGYLKSGSEDGI